MAQVGEWTLGRAQSLKGLEPQTKVRVVSRVAWRQAQSWLRPPEWAGSSGAKPHQWGGIQEPRLWAAGWQAVSSFCATLCSHLDPSPEAVMRSISAGPGALAFHVQPAWNWLKWSLRSQPQMKSGRPGMSCWKGENYQLWESVEIFMGGGKHDLAPPLRSCSGE